MIRKILPTTDHRLRIKSKEVIKIDKKVLKLVQDMWDTLAIQKDPEGIGLAAPQVGKNLRVFVASYKNFKRIVINPLIISKSPVTKHQSPVTKHEIMEGCLSLPNYYGPLKRSQKVKVRYQTLSTDHQSLINKIEDFVDFNAQIILHEIDHLEGILFIDHLLKEKKSLYKVKGDSWEEVELI